MPGFRVRLIRTPPVRRRRGQSALLLLAAFVALAGVAALPASGGNGLNLSLNIAPQSVKSVTVSPTSASYGQCVGGSSTPFQLGFPNGECQGQGSITVTNGQSDAIILVAGSDMVPADQGPHWTLCKFASTCTQQVPGPNQYYETLSTSPGYNNTGPAPPGPGPFLSLSNQAVCDTDFAGGQCGATVGPGFSQSEYLAITGPSSSTDQSPSWSTVVTWTAS